MEYYLLFKIELQATADLAPGRLSSALFWDSQRPLCEGVIITAFRVNSRLTKLEFNWVNFPRMGVIGLIGFAHTGPQHEAEKDRERLCVDIAIQLNKETGNYKEIL